MQSAPQFVNIFFDSLSRHTECPDQTDVYIYLFLKTDSICHSSLPHMVLEKVTLTTIKFRIYSRTKVDPMFYSVYISTPLKS